MKKKSRKLAKIIAPIALASGCLAAIPTTGCSNTAMYHYDRKLGDYIHEITYDDYRFDSDYETTKETEAFGCSSVRCGNFYGRNFDYVYNDTPEFIIHVKADPAKKRYASLGVATHFGLREDKLNAGKYDKQLELIPNLTLDGINENGVICSSNVVSMEPKTSDDVIPQTHPGDPSYRDLHMLFIPRFVLDNATSAEDAVNKLKTRNIMGNLNDKLFLHIMIADANETRIIEFMQTSDSGNHFGINEKIFKKSEVPIMTNYYCNVEAEFVNDEKFGKERYEILNTYKGEATSMEGMAALMERVKFSQAYDDHDNAVPLGITSSDGKVGDITSE
ncbi:MAG: carcinine hydrolase/isopenicillin-N N-acyltransferase family protein [Mycoplasmoidaceae bacterium]|nr:carcinine hydrolase/isopenicillin-N N-acyltransferase family protein [Mycoplasmoidaceae bacterium]